VTNIALNRTVIVQLTNNSGGPVAQGDIVIIDTSDNSSFITTNIEGNTNSTIAVIVEPFGILDGNIGAVATQGWVSKINLVSSASIGDFIKTSTTTKKGVAATPGDAGIFAQVLESGVSPTAILSSVSGQFGTSITVAVDEVIYWNRLSTNQNIDISIPSGYDSLDIFLIARDSRLDSYGSLDIYFNGDHDNSHYYYFDNYVGSADFFATYTSGAFTTLSTIDLMANEQPPENYGFIQINIPNPSTTEQFKLAKTNNTYFDMTADPIEAYVQQNNLLWSGGINIISTLSFHSANPDNVNALASGSIIRVTGRRTRNILAA
jgi:hypothetical protein